MKKNTVRMLTESAIMIAVATVLSMIKIDLPFGGGVTVVSMLPIVIISHRWGWRRGLVTAFVYSAIQLLLGLDNVGYASSFIMAAGIVLLDYIIAYTVIGLSGLFDGPLGKTRKSLAVGIAVTFCLRFLCHLVMILSLPLVSTFITMLFSGLAASYALQYAFRKGRSVPVLPETHRNKSSPVIRFWMMPEWAFCFRPSEAMSVR